MTAAVITLAVLAAGLGTALVTVTIWLRAALVDAIANDELADTYKQERDTLAESNATNAKRADVAEARVAALSVALEAAEKKNSEHVVKEIADAPTNADAADAFVSVFGVPILPQAGDPGPGDGGS